MTEEDNFDASPELQEFVILSIGMGLDNLQKEGSLIPMLVSVQKDEYALAVLVVEPDKLMETAADRVAALPAETDRYALVFNGKIGIGDDVMHAVIAQAGERTAAHGYTVFQAYDSETFAAIGEPEYGGRTDQLLRR